MCVSPSDIPAWLSAGAHACLPWMDAVTFQNQSAVLGTPLVTLCSGASHFSSSHYQSLRLSSVLSDPELCLLSPQSTPSPSWPFLSPADLVLPGLVHLSIPQLCALPQLFAALPSACSLGTSSLELPHSRVTVSLCLGLHLFTLLFSSYNIVSFSP